MLERPTISPADIIACLEADYGLSIAHIVFLPLGADPDTAVYRAVANDTTAYFVKLRRGNFPQATVALPNWLAASGMQHIIAPLATQSTGASWTQLDSFTLILYPFVAGHSAFASSLSSDQWVEFGVALHQLHTAAVPPALSRELPHETYTAYWRNRLSAFQKQAAEMAFADPSATELARVLQHKHDTINHMVTRAAQLGQFLAVQPLEQCLCHGDIHAWNILVDAADRLFLVDWDTLIVAPKEHDLMFIGAGIGGIWNTAQEAAWFYRGYGDTALNLTALTYYRYERIVQDFAVTCEQLLTSNAGGDDRAVMLHDLITQFQPDSVVAMAYATDERLQAQPSNKE